MDLRIDIDSGQGRRDAVYHRVRQAILDGSLRRGEALPPSRELARTLAVSRNTVSAAYDRLVAEGFLVARVGSGTFVRTGPQRAPRQARPDKPPTATDAWSRLPESPYAAAPAPQYDFRPGLPDVTRFPLRTWRRLANQQLSGDHPAALDYGDPQGDPDLRAAIARRVGVSRGVRVPADHVIVTSGAQQALDLVARVLLRPGDRVAVEDPGYPPPRMLFAAAGANVSQVPVDEHGLVVGEIPSGTRLVYVTPSHQFPLGSAMSLARRLELLAWADGQDAVLVEDDYDTEFRYTDRPLEPLRSLDSGGRVLYVGSFSKVLFPGLRLGYLVAPPSLLAPLGRAKYLTDRQCAGPAQAALARFLAEGAFARHVRTMRREYQARHDLIHHTLESDFAGVLTPLPCSAGLHLSAVGEVGRRPLVQAARLAGIALYALDDFSVRKPARPGLVFGFGAVPVPAIVPGLHRLRELIDERNAHGRG